MPDSLSVCTLQDKIGWFDLVSSKMLQDEETLLMEDKRTNRTSGIREPKMEKRSRRRNSEGRRKKGIEGKV